MSETRNSPKLYGSIAEIREANKAAGQHWFEKDTLRFFDGIVPEDQPIVHGRFFVSSEQFDSRSRRMHTLRYANPDAAINTVGDFQQFDSFDEAREALRDGITRGVTVRQVSGTPDADPTHYHWQVYLGDLAIDCAHTKAEPARRRGTAARAWPARRRQAQPATTRWTTNPSAGHVSAMSSGRSFASSGAAASTSRSAARPEVLRKSSTSPTRRRVGRGSSAPRTPLRAKLTSG